LIDELTADLWSGISDAHPHIAPSTMEEQNASTEHDTHIYNHPWSGTNGYDAAPTVFHQFANTCNIREVDEYGLTSLWTLNELFK
jgi:hypothetical protein